MFCSTATTVAILQNACPTPQSRLVQSLGERGGMMSDDVILRRSPYPASQQVFTRKVNVKGRLTGGCAHCVITTTFASVGSLQPVKGALRRYAPLTGFHSKGRSHWSLASPSCPFEHGNDSALYITVNVNQRFAYECCIAFAGVVTLPNLMGV